MPLNDTGSSMPDLSNQSSKGFTAADFEAGSTVPVVVFDLIKTLRKFICCSLPAKTAVCVMSFEVCVVVKKNIVGLALVATTARTVGKLFWRSERNCSVHSF